MRLINSEIRHGSLSPDRTLFFGLSPSGGRLAAALYTLDGIRLTEPFSLAMPEVLTFPELPKLQNFWDAPWIDIVEWAWSPDGKKIACRDTDGALWVIDMAKGARQLAKNTLLKSSLSVSSDWPQANTIAVVWSPEGDHLLVQSGKQVWVVNVEE